MSQQRYSLSFPTWKEQQLGHFQQHTLSKWSASPQATLWPFTGGQDHRYQRFRFPFIWPPGAGDVQPAFVVVYSLVAKHTEIMITIYHNTQILCLDIWHTDIYIYIIIYIYMYYVNIADIARTRLILAYFPSHQCDVWICLGRASSGAFPPRPGIHSWCHGFPKSMDFLFGLAINDVFQVVQDKQFIIPSGYD